MKLKQILAIVLSMALVACISIAATVAYLTSDTDAVVNTFTFGKVDITLDETAVNEDGQIDDSASPQATMANEYHLYPGKTYDKNPTVHVTASTDDNVIEPCWVFVKVQNDLGTFEAVTENEEGGYKSIEDQIKENWTAIEGKPGVYYYSASEDPVQPGTDLEVFSEFKIASSVTDLTGADEDYIKVWAYAVQAEGFDTALDAWESAPKADW